MSTRRASAHAPLVEMAVALLMGCAGGLLVPSAAFGRVDEVLITFLSVVVGAAIPGVAITAAAQRPPMESAVEARKLGGRLQDQVRFWFGYLFAGGLSVLVLIVGRALSWTLMTPRPHFLPPWVPHDGGAWLVAVATTLIAFTVVRLRHAVRAVLDLVQLGTTAHVEQSLEKRRQVQEAVRDEIARQQQPGDRGTRVEVRERLPRH